MLKGHKSSLLAVPAVLLAGLIINTNVFADDSTDFSITVNSSISLRVSSGNVGFDITPNKNGVYNSASFNVYSSTNNVSGYSLVMSTDSVDLVSNTINPTTSEYPTIPTLTETTNGISEADFRATADSTILNHYGVAIGSANFNTMKDSQEIKKTEANNTAEDTTSIDLAAKLDLNTVPGVYSTTINFQMTANPITPSVPFIDPDDDPTKPTVHPCAKLGDLECEDTDEDGTPDALVFPANSLLRTYEIAYTKAGKPMYVEDSNMAIGWRPMTDADLSTIGGKEVRFAMQDIKMTYEENNTINSVCDWAASSVVGGYTDDALVMDLRDGKSYWIAKLADGRCWMTQNLGLNLNSSKQLTHDDTDLGWTVPNPDAVWTPLRSTVMAKEETDPIWEDDNFTPYSINNGDGYVVSSGNDNNDLYYDSLNSCISSVAATREKCRHYSVGNYYNWTAAIAENNSNTTALTTDFSVAPNSICPAGWRLPTGPVDNNGVDHYYSSTSSDASKASEYARMLYAMGITAGVFDSGYSTAGFEAIRTAPLYLARFGVGYSASYINNDGDTGQYLTSTVYTFADDTHPDWVYSDNVWFLDVTDSSAMVNMIGWLANRGLGLSLRCIAR